MNQSLRLMRLDRPGRRSSRAAWCIVSAIILSLLPATTLTAQRAPDLQGEVERLRSENTRLAEELAAARAEIQRLRIEVQRLSGTPRTPTRTVPPDPAPAAGVDESRPFASPRSIEKSLQERYAERFADVPRGTPGDAVRERYLRSVDEWRRAIHREMTASVEWHMLILEAEENRGQIAMRLQAVDPETGAHLGEPITAGGSRSIARTYAVMAERGGLEHPLLVRGVVRPTLSIDPQRETPGPFDVPKLIGPFVQVEIAMSVQSIARPRPRPRPDDADEAESRGEDATRERGPRSSSSGD